MKAEEARQRSVNAQGHPKETEAKFLAMIKEAADEGYNGLCNIRLFKHTRLEAISIASWLESLGYKVSMTCLPVGIWDAIRGKDRFFKDHYVFNVNW